MCGVCVCVGGGCGGVSVCLWVCLSGYGFRHASRYGAEELDMGLGDVPSRLKSIFSK